MSVIFEAWDIDNFKEIKLLQLFIICLKIFILDKQILDKFKEVKFSHSENIEIIRVTSEEFE